MNPSRVTFAKLIETDDYADARYDVLLDGEKIGEVERSRETSVVAYAGVNYGRPVTRTRWSARYTINGGRHPEHGRRLGYDEHTTRINAAADLVRFVLGVNVYDARQIVKG